MKPIVTIVGRPNVGKSTLFNRLVGERRALVDDMPGVTRDRHYGDCLWGGRAFTVVDTGGYDPEATDDLLGLMRAQARLAMEEADVVLFLMDGKEGVTPADEQIAAELRQAKNSVVMAVNKLETARRREEAYDFYRVGVEHLHFISAAHGQGVADLLDVVVSHLPPQEEEEEFEGDEIRVAVVGRPNAGKSTLVNRLIGQERLLASSLPGTTRDAIDSLVDHDGKRYRFIDTAGIRRKRSIRLRLESYSVIKAFKSIDRADVVLLVIDASEGEVEQDARLAGLIHEKGRGCVIVVNKWDVIEKDTDTAGAFVKRLREHLKFMPYAPVLFVSALTGQRAPRIFALIDRVVENRERRIPTAQLNHFLEDVIRKHELPVHRKRRRVKIYYMSQVRVRPPTFVAVCNYPDSIHFSYQRYLVNALREAFDFEGTPIRLKLKARTRRARGQVAEMKPVEAAAAAGLLEDEE